jgi:hypothetical protein
VLHGILSTAERALFAQNAYGTRIYRGIEPIPHQCLTVLANRQADYQTALPAWYDIIGVTLDIIWRRIQVLGPMWKNNLMSFQHFYIFSI